MERATPALKAKALRAAAGTRPLWLPVTGSSMATTVLSGDEVLIEQASRPRIAEVWAYVGSSGEIVVHRYVWNRGGGALLIGDATDVADDLVPLDQLVGRVASRRSATTESHVGRLSGLFPVARWSWSAAVRRVRRHFH